MKCPSINTFLAIGYFKVAFPFIYSKRLVASNKFKEYVQIGSFPQIRGILKMFETTTYTWPFVDWYSPFSGTSPNLKIVVRSTHGSVHWNWTIDLRTFTINLRQKVTIPVLWILWILSNFMHSPLTFLHNNDFQILHDIPDIEGNPGNFSGFARCCHQCRQVVSHRIHPTNSAFLTANSTSLCKQHTAYHPCIFIWYIYLYIVDFDFLWKI